MFRIARNHPKKYHLCQKHDKSGICKCVLAAPSSGLVWKLWLSPIRIRGGWGQRWMMVTMSMMMMTVMILSACLFAAKSIVLVHRSQSYLAVRFPEVQNRKGTEGGPVHSGEKPVVHTQCNFSCTTACHLKIHNQIHSGEMYFSCRQCNCACTTAGNLKRHMLTHSRAKPFGCSQCNNTFTTAQNL